jgi:predicted RNA methylase
MTSVTEHYEGHLAPVYLWMAGGIEAAMARGHDEVIATCPRPSKGQQAVDLGAGFGMHAIPVAKLGYSVLAIDSSPTLLEVLRSHIGASPIKAVHDDLLMFRRHLGTPVSLILCLGDTLTHLTDRRSVEGLFADAFESLGQGGRFMLTFRDFSSPLTGVHRFIPVRSDADRVMTCFLEYQEESVTVHDILHERAGSAWQQRVSSYQKLRLSAEWVRHALEANGFEVTNDQGPAGMVRVIAQRPP